MDENQQTIPILLDPQSDELLRQKIAVPYTTTQPSGSPKVNGYRYIYFDGTDYWYYVYANGAWRSTKLDSTGFPTASHGDVYYRGASGASALSATGNSGLYLKSQGASVNPVFDNAIPYLQAKDHQTNTLNVTQTATDKTIDSMTLPAMGLNDMLMFNIMLDCSTNMAGGDTLKLKIGSSVLCAYSLSTGGTLFNAQTWVCMRNSLTAQMASAIGVFFGIATSNAVQTPTAAAIDMTASTTVDLVVNVTTQPRTYTLYAWNVVWFKG